MKEQIIINQELQRKNNGYKQWVQPPSLHRIPLKEHALAEICVNQAFGSLYLRTLFTIGGHKYFLSVFFSLIILSFGLGSHLALISGHDVNIFSDASVQLSRLFNCQSAHGRLHSCVVQIHKRTCPSVSACVSMVLSWRSLAAAVSGIESTTLPASPFLHNLLYCL